MFKMLLKIWLKVSFLEIFLEIYERVKVVPDDKKQ
jgi:hypothetical protein